MPDIDIPQNFEFHIEVDFAADGSLVAVAVPGADPMTAAGPDPLTPPTGPDVVITPPDPGPVAPDPGVGVLPPPDLPGNSATPDASMSHPGDEIVQPALPDGGWFF